MTKIMNMKKNALYILIMMCLSLGVFSSCSEDKLGDTLFDDSEEELDPESYTYKLDYFLQENYLKPYNIQFQYKMKDISADMNYNLVPAEYSKSIDMAVLGKYLWLDVFKEISGEDFVKQNMPKFIHLIGSAAINPSSGVEELGQSENGLKITLYKINNLNVENIEKFTSSYFLTIYHEFTHILHQTKLYPAEYNVVSSNQYDADKWTTFNDHVKLSAGMISPYACKSVAEDFAETLANYIVLSPEKWDEMLEIASQGWEVVTKNRLDEVEDDDIELDRVEVAGTVISITILRRTVDRDAEGNKITDPEGNVTYTDPDGIEGDVIINQKLNLIKDWLQKSWNIDINKLREAVQKRKAELDIVSLRKELDNIPTSNN